MPLVVRGLLGPLLVTRGLASGTGRAACGTDQLARGLAWLSGQLQAHASEPVVYARGGSRVALCATFGRTRFEVRDDLGVVRLEWSDRDFLIPAVSLKPGGSATTPRRGDVITYTDADGAGHTFEVFPFGS